MTVHWVSFEIRWTYPYHCPSAPCQPSPTSAFDYQRYYRKTRLVNLQLISLWPVAPQSRAADHKPRWYATRCAAVTALSETCCAAAHAVTLLSFRCSLPVPDALAAHPEFSLQGSADAFSSRPRLGVVTALSHCHGLTQHMGDGAAADRTQKRISYSAGGHGGVTLTLIGYHATPRYGSTSK